MKLFKKLLLFFAFAAPAALYCSQDVLLPVGALSIEAVAQAARWNISNFEEKIKDGQPISTDIANLVMYDAIYSHKLDILKMTLGYGANLAQREAHKGRPLAYAQKYGTPPIVEFIEQELAQKAQAKKAKLAHLMHQETQEEQQLAQERKARREAHEAKERESQEQKRIQHQKLTAIKKQQELQQKAEHAAQQQALRAQQEQEAENKRIAEYRSIEEKIRQQNELRAQRQARKQQKALEKQLEQEQTQRALDQEIETVSRAIASINFEQADTAKNEGDLPKAAQLYDETLAQLRTHLQVLNSKSNKTPKLVGLLKDGEQLFIEQDGKLSSIKRRIRRHNQTLQSEQQNEVVQAATQDKSQTLSSVDSPKALSAPASPNAHIQRLRKMQANFLAARLRYIEQNPDVAQQLQKLAENKAHAN